MERLYTPLPIRFIIESDGLEQIRKHTKLRDRSWREHLTESTSCHADTPKNPYVEDHKVFMDRIAYMRHMIKSAWGNARNSTLPFPSDVSEESLSHDRLREKLAAKNIILVHEGDSSVNHEQAERARRQAEEASGLVNMLIPPQMHDDPKRPNYGR